jgi:hypothetical protein
VVVATLSDAPSTALIENLLHSLEHLGVDEWSVPSRVLLAFVLDVAKVIAVTKQRGELRG